MRTQTASKEASATNKENDDENEDDANQSATVRGRHLDGRPVCGLCKRSIGKRGCNLPWQLYAAARDPLGQSYAPCREVLHQLRLEPYPGPRSVERREDQRVYAHADHQ